MFIWQVHQQWMPMVLHALLVEGQAQGNVVNHADVADQVHVGLCMGKDYVYQSPWVPDSKSSETSIKYEVTPQLKPILKALALKFSPVSSKLYLLIYGQIQTFDALLLEFNQGSMFMKKVVGLPNVVMKLLLKITMTSCGHLMRLIHSIFSL